MAAMLFPSPIKTIPSAINRTLTPRLAPSRHRFKIKLPTSSAYQKNIGRPMSAVLHQRGLTAISEIPRFCPAAENLIFEFHAFGRMQIHFPPKCHGRLV